MLPGSACGSEDLRTTCKNVVRAFWFCHTCLAYIFLETPQLSRPVWMPQHSSLGRWQAHYDLKDPAGLARFLIHSDIKLIRAECGSPDPEVSMFMECDERCHGILLWCTTKNVRDNSLNFCHPLPFVVADAKWCNSKSSWGLEFCVYMPEPLKMDFVYCFEMFLATCTTLKFWGTWGHCWIPMVAFLEGRRQRTWPSSIPVELHVAHW